MRRFRLTAVGLLSLLLVGVSPAEPAPARPDRALFDEARKALETLRGSPKLQIHRNEWEKVAARFRRVVTRYPQSGFCDDALLATGHLYREMAKRFKAPRYAEDAVASYRMLVSEYPSSRLGDRALFAVYEMARDIGDKQRAAEAARAYLDVYPRGDHAVDVKSALRKAAPAQAATLPSPPPPGLAQVFNLRSWSGASSTRIVIDVEREVAIKYDRIANPERLWIDLNGARLHPNLKDRTFPVGDGLLEQIRIAQNRSDVVRVVLDFKDVKDHTVFYLQDPTRLVVDVRGAAPMPVAEGPARQSPSQDETGAPAARDATPAPRPLAADSPRPIASPSSSPPDERRFPLPTRQFPGVLTPPEPATIPNARRHSAPPPSTIVGPDTARRASTTPTLPRTVDRSEPSPPQPPAVNRTGSYSLARQLGLSARTIVIDAGHGGHDPGTIGRGGLEEKDLVLDIALRLEKQVREGLGAEVVMTRSTDVFVPLEERTAIANSHGADLFLSIHANSGRSPSAHGIETYFLNFAQNPHAEAVAARENAISTATLKDLQNLVKAITLNSKIDESRDFAASVHEAMVNSLRSSYPVIDRGVHTAPFYVLIGANMPSVLAEIAFLSHPDDERRLKTPEYRERIAASLVEGVHHYLSELDRSDRATLTATTRRSTVVSSRGRR